MLRREMCFANVIESYAYVGSALLNVNGVLHLCVYRCVIADICDLLTARRVESLIRFHCGTPCTV
jgi:hypothetical protein